MTIIALTAIRTNSATVLVAQSDLAPPVYFHWFVDGLHSPENGPRFAKQLDAGDAARVQVMDTTDPNFDWAAAAPQGWPARRTLWWVKKEVDELDVGTGPLVEFKIEQNRAGAGWVTIAIVRATDAWAYSVMTPRLDDLVVYDWRVTPVDRAGNEGTPLDFAADRVVRTPDAPNFTAAFSSGTQKVTFTAKVA